MGQSQCTGCETRCHCEGCMREREDVVLPSTFPVVDRGDAVTPDESSPSMRGPAASDAIALRRTDGSLCFTAVSPGGASTLADRADETDAPETTDYTPSSPSTAKEEVEKTDKLKESEKWKEDIPLPESFKFFVPPVIEPEAPDNSTLPVAPFPQRPKKSKFSVATWVLLEKMFRLLNTTGSGCVSAEEAVSFFKTGFGNQSAVQMFAQVDTNRSGYITPDEFVKFWELVLKDHSDAEIRQGIKEMLENHEWVIWAKRPKVKVTRDASFPRKPLLSSLSSSTWQLCQELFIRIDGDGNGSITRLEAKEFFGCYLKKISVDIIFGGMDEDGDGFLTGQEFMDFWLSVKKSGHSEAQIREEIQDILEGGSWVQFATAKAGGRAALAKQV
eukprot:gb/GFBE01020933.1/.p1 GENE.gb/GFBE01020933.1/~~gb/GFBE01020933.1/.p1  ORF type:complete len:387 (+),score=69.06 gb/GFBE01020933.1/:1-1161(+)